MKKTLHSLGLTLFLLVGVKTFAQTSTKFNDGYLTVFKVTSGSSLTSDGTAIVAEEYDPTTPSQITPNFSVALPTSGMNRVVTSGSSATAGGMTRSENGRYLIIPGYDTTVGAANSNSPFTTNGVLRTLNGTGTVGAGISGGGTINWFTGNNSLRGGTSDDLTNYWMSGSTVGIKTSTNGTTVTTVSTTSTNTREVFIYNGQLYFTTGAGTQGIYSVGSGKPITSAQTSTLLFTPTNTDVYAFSLSPDGNTIYYVASTGGGIYRSTNNGSVWTAGTKIFNTASFLGIAVDWSGYTFNTSAANGAIIYACKASAIIAANDNGINTVTITNLRTEPNPNNAFRQIAFSPIKQTAMLGANTPAAGNINAAATNAVLFQFNVNADEGNSTVKKVIVNQTGTASIGTGNDISNFRLIDDANNNGIAESGEISASLATGTVSGSTITFGSIALSNYIAEGSSKNFIVIGDVSASASNAGTFIPSIISNKTLNGISYTSNIVNAGSSWVNSSTNAIAGNTQTIISSSPSIVLNTTNFNGAFGTIAVSSSSASSPLIVSGSNLTANLIVTPPTGFEIRTGSNAFSTNAITLTPTAGTVAATTIDVRFTPLSAIAYSANVTCTSTGATSQNAAVSGNGTLAASATQLVITNINPASPFQNSAFAVTVQAQDASNVAQNVIANTNVTLSLMTGTGTLGGTLTGTITAGTNSVIITGVTYNTAQTGIVLTATRISGDVLTAGNSAPFNVLAMTATQLAFVNVPATGVAATNLTSFTVEARQSNNTVDATFTGNITVAKAFGNGTLSGTATVAAVAGVATFNTLRFNIAGTDTLYASATGLVKDTSNAIVITAALSPSMTEVILPQYIEGNSSTNATRLPYTYRATLTNLIPNATYHYYNEAVASTDASTYNGVGNCIFAIQSGFIRTTSPSLTTAGAYNSLISDANGSYTGWFVTEPTGNARFTSGGNVFMRIMLNDGAGGTTVVNRVTTADSIHVINLSTAATGGTGLSGNSSAIPKNFVFVYDNINGTGRPISGTFVESDSVANTTTNSYATFYATSVDGIAGAYGTIIPNTNANGIQRIEQRDFTAGTIVGCPSTDADGVWASGANTVNPVGGTTAVVITSTDVPLSPVATVAVGGSVTANGNATVCAGTNSGTLTLAGYTGNIVKWQSSNDNFSSDIHDVANTTTSQTYSNLTQTTSYRAVIGGCSTANSSAGSITVTPLPTVTFAPFTAPICSNATALSLTGGAPAGGVYSGTGVSAGSFNPTVSGTGTFTITYTVTSSSCSNAATQSVTVHTCATGVQENEAGDINVFPNPTIGVCNITIKNANVSELLISIVDIRGQEVYKELDKNVSNDYSKQINLDGLAKGFYVIKLTSTDTNLKVQKLIIQ